MELNPRIESSRSLQVGRRMSADPMLVDRFVLGMRSGEEYCEQRSAEEENQTASRSNVSDRLECCPTQRVA